MTEARAMAASLAARGHDNNNNNNNNTANNNADADNDEDSTKEDDNEENNWGRKAAGDISAAATNQSICCPTPQLVLDNAGATALLSLSTSMASHHPSHTLPLLYTSLLDKRRRHWQTTGSKRRRDKRQRRQQLATRSLMMGGISPSCRQKCMQFGCVITLSQQGLQKYNIWQSSVHILVCALTVADLQLWSTMPQRRRQLVCCQRWPSFATFPTDF